MVGRTSAKRVLIVAGEASGDLHAANLVRSLSAIMPAVDCYGMGGTAMAEAGVRLIQDLRTVSVIGLVEVVSKLPVILRTLRSLVREAVRARPDVAILVDFPDFNLRLAERLKGLGVLIVWYISPQLWAWRAQRLPRFAAVVDYMIVILPFEVDFYNRYGLRVHFVGHPLLDIVRPSAAPEEILCRHDLKQGSVIALLPGSRRVELALLLKHLVGAARLLYAADRSRQFVLPVASTINMRELEPFLPKDLPIIAIENSTYDLLSVASCAVVAAGTATLEAALLGTPQVIVGRVKPLTWLIWSRYTRLPYYGLPNWILGERFVPELIQHNAHAAAIAAELERLLASEQLRESLAKGYEAVRLRLGSSGASERAAGLVARILDGDSTIERFRK
ncbi:MAG: lipid-A-disaccharide synthase [Acidobacteriota bacterium]|nr:lipid-A-disaccharide synthase [Blastocatellia bacterium]MDW8411960.1 lipid-A-disaccharide synthase [Acidobacteriota bacterium]